LIIFSLVFSFCFSFLSFPFRFKKDAELFQSQEEILSRVMVGRRKEKKKQPQLTTSRAAKEGHQARSSRGGKAPCFHDFLN